MKLHMKDGTIFDKVDMRDYCNNHEDHYVTFSYKMPCGWCAHKKYNGRHGCNSSDFWLLPACANTYYCRNWRPI